MTPQTRAGGLLFLALMLAGIGALAVGAWSGITGNYDRGTYFLMLGLIMLSSDNRKDRP